MSEIEMIPVDELFFDYNNPRLVEFENISENSSEDEIINVLWEAMDVKELVLSIAYNGFFTNDPLIYTNDEGKKRVIEGNRRLAAVKVLLNPEKYQWDLPFIDIDGKKQISQLPAINMERFEAWKFIGFKHVNGPAKWGSYAKARYIAQVHNDFRIPLDNIAERIGDTHKTVRKLYRGLMVVEQAEKSTNFKREDAMKDHFAFSHLYTGLGYRGFVDYLQIKDENEDTQIFIPEEKNDELEFVFRWLYGSKKENIEPVVQSQNPHLRQLDAVLQNRESLAILKRRNNLEDAFELTKPVSNVFEEELFAAKASLVKAKGLISQGYDDSESLLKLAGSIVVIAEDLYDEMERKRLKKKPKKRITEND